MDLSEDKIAQGKSLLAFLDKNLDIRAAFWLYDKNRSQPWTLYLAATSPELDIKENPIEARKLLSQIKQQAAAGLNQEDVVLIPLDHPYINNIATMFTTGHDIGNINIANTQVNNLYIESLHLYRLEP